MSTSSLNISEKSEIYKAYYNIQPLKLFFCVHEG